MPAQKRASSTWTLLTSIPPRLTALGHPQLQIPSQAVPATWREARPRDRMSETTLVFNGTTCGSLAYLVSSATSSALLSTSCLASRRPLGLPSRQQLPRAGPCSQTISKSVSRRGGIMIASSSCQLPVLVGDQRAPRVPMRGAAWGYNGMLLLTDFAHIFEPPARRLHVPIP
jgi:hypothetical protein